ncbi:thioether cross-link-forming SCIFF peptide maturase [Petroclostridium sp. X23]|uniref:thioether cross-link-forming SCIFF peptide maturase n=1 Tax=Petroclostridium sp. X23 TaxID=3045146 RepID=UPI0024ACCF4C|nr:thioether cross-link-forming SCIFF peptide maturase [Petroclostridium sp. X23]WHH59031.1 thioether cross-link-forming SCIFF peptide maturase [Petroclostridium sp. X23]
MIHKFSMNGINIVLDVYSGAVHVIDDIVYDVLEYYGVHSKHEVVDLLKHKYDIGKIEEAYQEVNELKENELLFTEDPYQDYIDKWDKRSVVKALCLHVSHDCNLRCKYCFASTGSFHGDRLLMSSDIGRKAIDFVINNSGKRRNIEVDFFGGEPLMNFDVVKDILEYAKTQGVKNGKEFRFTITTNGLLLTDEIKQYINENMSNIVLSIDGSKEVNDNMRVRVDGRGCYDAIVPKFLDVAESRNQDNYYVRGTFTRKNLDFAKDVLHLADLGFKQTSVEPVVAAESEGYALREEDLPTLFEEYEKLAVEYLARKKENKGFNFFHFMIDLDQGPCVAKRLSGCGSGHEYVAVTPEGDIYPCHQFVGNSEFKMGNVIDGTMKEEIKNMFQKSNVYTKDKCKNCWAMFYCSGGCPANAYQFNNDIDQPYSIGCELEKKRVECALMIQAALAL